jgi:hypothetical protein
MLTAFPIECKIQKGGMRRNGSFFVANEKNPARQRYLFRQKTLPKFSKNNILTDGVFGFMGKQSPSAGGRSATIFLWLAPVRHDFPIFEIIDDRPTVRKRQRK